MANAAQLVNVKLDGLFARLIETEVQSLERAIVAAIDQTLHNYDLYGGENHREATNAFAEKVARENRPALTSRLMDRHLQLLRATICPNADESAQ